MGDERTQEGNAAGKASSPTTWVDRHADALFRYVVVRVKDRHVAEDLVQETFLAAIKSGGSFRGQSEERTWLIGILRHKLVDHLRKSGREKTVSDGAEGDDSFSQSVFDRFGFWKKDHNEWSSAADDVVEKEEFWATFKKCLEGLPAQQAEAFALKIMDDVPAEEVCKVLSVTPTNLWVMLHRARLRLRGCLEANWFERQGGEEY